jgi:hypothetical protein
VATVLDWAIKLRLFRARAERRCLPVARFPFLNAAVRRLSAALAAVGENGRDVGLGVLLGPRSPIPDEVARTGKLLAAAGLAWADLERFLNLRDEFYQIDTRFGQIGSRGVFTDLDRRGVLDHKLAGVDGVEAAMREPPGVGRARLRGETVRRLSGRGQGGCSWMAVFSPDGRTLDLSDPFTAAEVWEDPPVPSEVGDLPPAFPMDDPGRLQRMLDAMRRGYVRPRPRPPDPPEATEDPNR